MSGRNFSVQAKILTALAVVFLILMIATTWRMTHNERAMAQDLARQKATDVGSAYFDRVNAMMLTGTMSQRETLRKRYESQQDVIEVRLIRGDNIKKTFGKGTPSQFIADDLDRRALRGEAIVAYGQGESGRHITVLQPILASNDFRGTNCLTCHAVTEGSILGATRVTFSLAGLDNQITQNLLEAGGINLIMQIVGLAVSAWMLQYIVVRPLRRIRDTMQLIENDANLEHRLEIKNGDEIGQLSSAFNAMISCFAKSLKQVSNTTDHLNESANRISTVAEQTAAAATQQQGETDTVATAINELEATAVQVRSGASSASAASIEADKTASEGAQITREAIDGIHGLVSEIEQASEVIERLDSRSKDVEAVLDVIKGIAEQTNLLALNAAIEAARAGENGRGFAVVADEVRTLATRSHESTQEIENIVEQLQREARAAVATMTHAKESAEQRREQVQSADSGLMSIADHVGRIRELNAQMANAADEQSVVTHDVSRNVVNINSLAEQTANDAAQTTSATRDLLALSNELQALVNHFKF